MNRYISGSFISLLLVLPFYLEAQNSVDRMLRIDEKVYNLTFTMPEGYIECDSGFIFYCRDSKLSNAILYSIIKKDSSVKIGLSFIPVEDSATRAALKVHYPKLVLYDPNINYLRSARYRADTSRFPIIYYDHNYVKKKFNADNAVSISRYCIVPYHIWENNRTVFIAKNNVCHVELTYLYTDKMKNKISKEIKRTEGMIRFN